MIGITAEKVGRACSHLGTIETKVSGELALQVLWLPCPYWKSCAGITFDGQIGIECWVSKWLKHFGPWSLTPFQRDRSGCNSLKHDFRMHQK